MVMTGPYSDDDDASSYRRYSPRGRGFTLSHTRELPSAIGHAVYPFSRNSHIGGGHEHRPSDQASDDSNSRPRSRIPVACGRCRKRKIRCSGDQGGPCSNCKSAGNESCQFLRVSSTEAQMKSESAGYDYDSPAISRVNCRMIPFGPQSYGMAVDAYQYRNNSLSAYQFPANSVKSYYPQIPQYSDFGEEHVDYGLHASAFPMLPTEHLSIPNYTTSATGRAWTPTPQLPKTSLFLEPADSAYNHGQLPYHSSAFPLRPAISPEPKHLSLYGTTSLPTPLTVTDRLLPIPAANRQSQGSFLRTGESLLPVSQPGYQSYHGLMGTSMLSSLKNHSNATVHESSYVSMSSSSPESINSSQMAYSSGQILRSQSQDIYQPTDNESLYAANDSSDSSYGHSSPTSKQGSQSSHATNSDGSLPPPPNASLVNGHTYVPSPYHPSYPPPPIEIQSSAPPRHPSTSITAA